jgi:multisubunit Na+/H+ antiporter MnhG subunit
VIVKDIFSDILLGLAVLIVAGCAIGILVMPDAYDKVHFVTPAALISPLLVALAVMVQMGVYENTGQSFLALFFLAIAGPYLSHATLRAIRIREKGDWRPGREPRKRPAEEKEQ